MNDIIVMALPQSVFFANWQNPTLSASLQAQARFIWFNNLPTVEREPDVNDEEIVVVAQRLKTRVTTIAMNLESRRTATIKLPCVGEVSGEEIASLAIGSRFKITNKGFGPGRAGENGIGTSKSEMPIVMNAKSLKGYDALPGGLDFLVGHEIAHGLKSMQEFNQKMWTDYINAQGKGLSIEEQKKQYPNSDQFAANEARANTVGRALLEQLKNPNIKSPGFTPTHDYADC